MSTTANSNAPSSTRSHRHGSGVSLVGMAGAILALHVAGFSLLLAQGGREPGASAPLSVGVGVTAYVLGLRHAFDADHIAAIDNTTRKLLNDGKKPVSVGFWFSLGHSTVVLALMMLLSGARRS